MYGRDLRVPFVLGAVETVSPELALRWLTRQALRIADGLDPDPRRTEWLPVAFAREVPPGWDAPATLRGWAGDPLAREVALARLKRDARPLFVVGEDHDCRYTLSVSPRSVGRSGRWGP